MDGIRDRVELGHTQKSDDRYTIYDTDPRNCDAYPFSTTDPLDRDSDADRLPDGAIEGWGLQYDGIVYQEDAWGMNGIMDWNQDWNLTLTLIRTSDNKGAFGH